VTQERLVPPADLDLMLAPAPLDLVDLPAQLVNLDKPDLPVNPESPHNPNPLYLENPEKLEMLDHPAPLAHLELLETMDPLDLLDQRVPPAPMVPPVPMVNPVLLVLLAPLAVLEKKVSVPNIALWMVASSSKMELVVKQQVIPKFHQQLQLPSQHYHLFINDYLFKDKHLLPFSLLLLALFQHCFLFRFIPKSLLYF